MPREIELKIHLEDPRGFLGRLKNVAQAEGAYYKVDTYFRGPEGSFRLRESNGRPVVCRKEKSIEAGVEVNLETEFQIDDSYSFRKFSLSLGYQEWYRKEKIGQTWRWGEILIEEGEVSSLGWFAEFELIVDEQAGEEAILRARESLYAALESLEVPKSLIEARTYSQLLGHRGK